MSLWRENSSRDLRTELCTRVSELCGPSESCILGDPGADSGGEGKSKRAGKYGTKKSKERREEPLGTIGPFIREKIRRELDHLY